MTEKEYALVSNLARVRDVRMIMLQTDRIEIHPDEWRQLQQTLSKWETALTRAVDMETEE